MNNEITVRQLLNETGLKKKEVAKRVGVCKATLNRWEAGGIPKTGPARAAIYALYVEYLRNKQNGQGS